MGGKGYSYQLIRRYLARSGIRAVIPRRSDSGRGSTLRSGRYTEIGTRWSVSWDALNSGDV